MKGTKSVNKCETLNICILGDIAKHIGCRKPWCPKKTMADVVSPILPGGMR
jgi:hypothetical protein